MELNSKSQGNVANILINYGNKMKVFNFAKLEARTTMCYSKNGIWWVATLAK